MQIFKHLNGEKLIRVYIQNIVVADGGGEVGELAKMIFVWNEPKN
jgi:hypothetical protein